MSACAQCSTVNPEGAKFCFACGTALEAGCPECGQPLPSPDAAFCPSCGARIKKEGAESQMLKLVSILFADVVGSTSRAEAMFAEDIRDLMSDFFEAMTEEIRGEGGRVEKFIGDAVMAVFGVPVAHEDDAVRAARTARRMLRRLEQWNEGRDPLHQIKIRIGVNTGDVLAAAPGSDLMVTGDAVNVAARLEQAAAAGTVVIGPRTERVVRPYFILEEIEPLVLKGKSEPMPAFLVKDEKEIVEERGIPGLAAPLIGREAELGVLEETLERVGRLGKAELVKVIAEPGVGKSRLIREFTGVRSGDTSVVIGRCLPYGEGITLWPLGEILRSETGIFTTDPPDVALDKIVKLVKHSIPGELTPDRERTVAALASTIGLADGIEALGGLDPRERFKELESAWSAFFTALATTSSSIVVIEDIHWADPTMLEMLDHFVHSLEAPVLFLCPTRPDLATMHPDWGKGKGFTSVPLHPLTSEQSVLLMETLLAHAELPAELSREIISRAEGNPFFLEEIVRRLMDEGHLVHSDGRWRAAPDISGVEIPDNVQGVILARIDLLPAAQKKVMQHAAVIGRSFWGGTVRHLIEAPDLEETLRALEARELLFELPSSSMAGETEYTFKHILIRDVAYETLPRKFRAKSHVGVTEWIKMVSGQRAEELSELIAHHHHQAFTYTKSDDQRLAAKEYYGIASRKACERFATEQAENYGWLVVDLSNEGRERIESLEHLGDLYFMSFGMDGAWKVFTEGIEEVRRRQPTDGELLARLAAKAAIVPTRWEATMRTALTRDQIDEVIRGGLAAAGESDTRERALLLASQAFMQIGGYEDMNEEGEQAARTVLEVAERLGDPDLISAAVDAAARWLLPDGRHGQVYEINRRRLALIPSLTDVKEICDVYITAAWSSSLSGRFTEAVQHATACMERAEGVDPGSYLLGLLERMIGHFMVGEWDKALVDQAEIERLSEGSDKLPSPHLRLPYAYAFFCHQLRGDEEVAARYLTLLEEFDRNEAASRDRPYLRAAVLARVLAHRGDLDDAKRLLRLEKSAVLGSHLEAACEVIAAREEWDEAPGVVVLAREESIRAELHGLPFFADRLEGQWLASDGRTEEGTVCLDRAAHGFDDLGATWEAAYSRLILAGILATTQREETRAQLNLAKPVFERLRSVAELQRADELLESL